MFNYKRKLFSFLSVFSLFTDENMFCVLFVIYLFTDK